MRGRIDLKYLIMVMLIVVSHAFNNTFAQSISVSGTVMDNAGSPLPGVSVIVKGTSIGVATSIDGEYVLNAPAAGTLEFSSLGLKSQEIIINGRSKIDVTMSDDSELLDELVVIGYGAVKRKDVTTAISSVSTKDLEQKPISLVSQAIQGKAAGVSVISPNGAPGAGMVIRVRGTTSLNGSNDPLYVVDGVPMTDINFLSANDIESIQILKDASSAAIYGSRAANGVVMISTKTGSQGVSRSLKDKL